MLVEHGKVARRAAPGRGLGSAAELARTWVLLPSASSSPRSLSAAVLLLLGFQAFSALFSFMSSVINTVAMILRGSFRGPG